MNWLKDENELVISRGVERASQVSHLFIKKVLKKLGLEGDTAT